jgi:hypothetical protein
VTTTTSPTSPTASTSPTSPTAPTGTAAPAPLTDDGPRTTTAARAVAARRLALVVCPLLAGAFALVAALNDPAAGRSGAEMTQLYIDNPDPLQWKSTGWHWAYAFWIAPAVLLARTVTGRGAWLANVAAFVGFAGLVTLPGLLVVDWYQSAIGQLYGLGGTQAVEDLMTGTMWGPAGFMVAGMGGFALGLPLAVAAQWRAGRMRWWALPAVVAALAASLIAGGAWWGAAVTTLFLAVFAVALARASRQADAV